MLAPGTRISPIVLTAGLIIMLAALLFAAFGRKHEVAPEVPPAAHQSR
jgi:hypothetical protein